MEKYWTTPPEKADAVALGFSKSDFFDEQGKEIPLEDVYPEPSEPEPEASKACATTPIDSEVISIEDSQPVEGDSQIPDWQEDVFEALQPAMKKLKLSESPVEPSTTCGSAPTSSAGSVSTPMSLPRAAVEQRVAELKYYLYQQI